MELSTSRGTDAAGAALIRRGGGFTLVKAPVPPDQLTQRPEYVRMESLLGEDSALLMGHARRITKGPASNPCNNHPILVDAVGGVHGRAVGIHNGTITNDDLLFAKYGYPRDGEVDSEVIFRLVAEACRFKRGKRRRLCGFLGELAGSMTFVCSLLQSSSRFVLFRGTEPICAYEDPCLGAVFFCSLPEHLREALSAEGIEGISGQPEMLTRHRVYVYDTTSWGRLTQPEIFSVPALDEKRVTPTFEELKVIAQARAHKWLMSPRENSSPWI